MLQSNLIENYFCKDNFSQRDFIHMNLSDWISSRSPQTFHVHVLKALSQPNLTLWPAWTNSMFSFFELHGPNETKFPLLLLLRELHFMHRHLVILFEKHIFGLHNWRETNIEHWKKTLPEAITALLCFLNTMCNFHTKQNKISPVWIVSFIQLYAFTFQWSYSWDLWFLEKWKLKCLQCYVAQQTQKEDLFSLLLSPGNGGTSVVPMETLPWKKKKKNSFERPLPPEPEI